MKRISTKKIAAVFASIFTFFAMTTAVSACLWFTYQPKEPKALSEK
jgi:hypothetical protein